VKKKKIDMGYLIWEDGTKTNYDGTQYIENPAPITRERYRQMKLLNKRRWQQIQELEIKIEQLEKELEK
jgi:hypothetical protein